MKILIAEPDAVSRGTLEMSLKKSGYEIITADNGMEAWKTLLEDTTIHLVIADGEMPDMKGLDLCKMIRTFKFPWEIYIILITSASEEEDLVESLRYGIDDYLNKPVNLTELFFRLHAAQRILYLNKKLRNKDILNNA